MPNEESFGILQNTPTTLNLHLNIISQQKFDPIKALKLQTSVDVTD